MLEVKNTTTNRQSQINPTFAAITNAPTDTRDTAPEIFVHCELCSAHATGRTGELRRRGWGIYEKVQFCPFHEEMI